MKRLLSLSALLALVGLGCGGGGSAHAQGGFSLSSIHGSYGFNFSVFASNPTGVLSGTGVYSVDGNGHLKGNETFNENGVTCSGSLSGTYTVNPDGTGTTSVTFTPTTQGCTAINFTQSLVIVDSGKIVKVSDTIATEETIIEE
jgi:hypothetical protein